LTGSVTTDSNPNYAAWLTPRVPIRLVPGPNSLRFFVLDGPTSGPLCSVSFRSAYL